MKHLTLDKNLILKELKYLEDSKSKESDIVRISFLNGQIFMIRKFLNKLQVDQ